MRQMGSVLIGLVVGLSVSGGPVAPQDAPGRTLLPERVFSLARMPEPDSVRLVAVTATAYAIGDGSGHWTYTGTHVRPGVMAVSHDLKWLLGRKVRVEGLGEFWVEDLMHRRWTKRIDIWLPSLQQARQFGIQKRRLEVVQP